MSKRLELLISTSTFGKINPKVLGFLEKEGFRITLNPYHRTLTKNEISQLLIGKDALIAGTEILDKEVFEMATTLKYICRLGIGMDNVDIAEAKARGIQIENTPSSHVDSVAELCLAGILNLRRNITSSHTDLISNNWHKQLGGLLKNQKVGLIGFGKVAQRLAELLMPFRCDVYAIDLNWDSDIASSLKVDFKSKEEILKECNIISLHIPYSHVNHNYVDFKELNSMKDDAMLINTSRGGLINELALRDHLDTHPGFKVYLDTFDVEPYSGRFNAFNNILLTPHIGSYAREARESMESQSAEKVINFFKSWQ